MLLAVFIFTMAFSFFLTMFMRRYALAHSLVDVPGERSSHQSPTPRGGGIAIVVTLLGAIVYLSVIGTVELFVALSLGGAGLIVALVGFWDDHGHVPARWRLLAHFFAAAWGLGWLNGFPPIVFWDTAVDLGWIGDILAAVLLVWLLNLYNFMDGINGIASIEAITVALGGALILWIVSASPVHPLFVALIGAVAGFLIWNFPQAKIFMGDACSGFLGLLLGLIAVWQAQLVSELFLAWIILLGVFITDATLTLSRRILRGDKFYEAHRSHAYQIASRRLRSHTPVSLAVGVINLVWLLPIATLVSVGYLPGALAVLVAYVPIIGLAFYFDAGTQH